MPGSGVAFTGASVVRRASPTSSQRSSRPLHLGTLPDIRFHCLRFGHDCTRIVSAIGYSGFRALGVEQECDFAVDRARSPALRRFDCQWDPNTEMFDVKRQFAAVHHGERHDHRAVGSSVPEPWTLVLGATAAEIVGGVVTQLEGQPG